MQLFFVGKYFSDKLFVGESVKDPPLPHKFRLSARGIGCLGLWEVMAAIVVAKPLIPGSVEEVETHGASEVARG